MFAGKTLGLGLWRTAPDMVKNAMLRTTMNFELMCVCPVTQSCSTLFNAMHCRPPGSSVLGIFQARVLEQVAISYSRGSSLTLDWQADSLLYHLGSPLFVL